MSERLKAFLNRQQQPPPPVVEEETPQEQAPQAEQMPPAVEVEPQETPQPQETHTPQETPPPVVEDVPPVEQEQAPADEPPPAKKKKPKKKKVKLSTQDQAPNIPRPNPKNKPALNEFLEKPPVSQEQAEKAANAIETVTSIIVDKGCSYFNPTAPEGRYRVTPTEKREIREVFTEYFKSVNWAISPTTALFLGIFSIYGSILGRAYMDRRSEKARLKKAEEMRQKAEKIREQQEAKERAERQARAAAVERSQREIFIHETPPPPVVEDVPPPPPVVEQPQRILTDIKESEEVVRMKELTDGRSNFQILPNGMYLTEPKGKYLGKKRMHESYQQNALIEKRRAELHKKEITSKKEVNKHLRAYCAELRKKYNIKETTVTKHKPFI